LRRKAAGARRHRGATGRLDGEASRQKVAVEIDRDDHVGAQRAADRDGNRIAEAAIDQPAAVDAGRAQDPGQGDRGAHRLVDRPGLQPDLAAGRQIGGDGGVFALIAFDRLVDADLLQVGHHLAAVYQPAARQADVGQAEDLAPGRRLRPLAQRAELARDIGGADQRADRRAADDVRLDAGLDQRSDDADMRPAARRAAAEGEPDAGTRHDGTVLP
jgi:hypothetical protein